MSQFHFFTFKWLNQVQRKSLLLTVHFLDGSSVVLDNETSKPQNVQFLDGSSILIDNETSKPQTDLLLLPHEIAHY